MIIRVLDYKSLHKYYKVSRITWIDHSQGLMHLSSTLAAWAIFLHLPASSPLYSETIRNPELFCFNCAMGILSCSLSGLSILQISLFSSDSILLDLLAHFLNFSSVFSAWRIKSIMSVCLLNALLYVSICKSTVYCEIACTASFYPDPHEPPTHYSPCSVCLIISSWMF